MSIGMRLSQSQAYAILGLLVLSTTALPVLRKIDRDNARRWYNLTF